MMSLYKSRKIKSSIVKLLRKKDSEVESIPLESVKEQDEGERLWKKYDQLARLQGYKELNFCISFDCDTVEDILASQEIDAWLERRGIARTYAVPGVLLEKGAKVYRQIAEQGAEFINHGFAPHATWNGKKYISSTFYHEMNPQNIKKDIIKGHQSVCNVIEKAPIGFRTPHFGLFQTEEQRTLIYQTLNELGGYHYSSSTSPAFAFQQGVYKQYGSLFEIPVSGSYASPESGLDSWSYILSSYYPKISQQYTDLFIETVNNLKEINVAGILNLYVDPSHVINTDAFFHAIAYVLECDLPTLTLGKIVNNI
ncbi:MAG: hypothetical protein JEZ06_21410 [Anaerolineaceae bacterium]|nr:hypothetical protein [Anaerolineaceae bacterium]